MITVSGITPVPGGGQFATAIRKASCSRGCRVRLLTATLAALLAFPAQTAVATASSPFAPSSTAITPAQRFSSVETDAPPGVVAGPEPSEDEPDATNASAEPTTHTHAVADEPPHVHAVADEPPHVHAVAAQESTPMHAVHPHEHTAAGPVTPKNTRVPAKMSRMQQVGWWSLFGGFVFTGVAATLGGVSAREQGRRRRLALVADPPTDGAVGESAQLAARADIERSRTRGRAFSTGALVVGAVAGAAALAGVVVLVVDVARGRPPLDRRARLGVGGIEVKF